MPQLRRPSTYPTHWVLLPPTWATPRPPLAPSFLPLVLSARAGAWFGGYLGEQVGARLGRWGPSSLAVATPLLPL